MSKPFDVDVLIVGAGPTGTTLALELAMQKVSFRIVDREPVRSDQSRAFALQPRSQELLNRHGAAQDLLPRGEVVHGVAVFIRQKQAITITLDDLGNTDTEFPLPLMVSQAETEHYLDSRLQTYGGKVDRPAAATAVVQDDDGVTVTLTRPDGPDETVRCRYVVGCDGAHSVVRKAARTLTFDGAPYPLDFILCDARLSDSNLPRLRLMAAFDTRFLGIFPLGGDVVRLVTTRAMGSGDDDPPPTLADFQAVWAKMTPPGSGTLHDPLWVTRFRLHHRGVNAYRDGRLFVAGDAAHIHSPIGGQGMNTGIQDAINLGWKLGAVLRGDVGGDRAEALLDSYHGERWPVGQSLLRGTDRLFSWVTSTNPVFVWLRNTLVPWILPWVVGSRSRRKTAFNFVSEFGINYRTSAIVGTAGGFAGPVRGGDRLSDGKLRNLSGGEDISLQVLCRGAMHHLLLFSGVGPNTASEEELQLVRKKFLDSKAAAGAPQVHAIYEHANGTQTGFLDIDSMVHAQYAFTRPGYIYVRPDGYIAHIGLLSSLDGFLAFLNA